MEMWFSEFHTPDVKHSIRVNRQLYSKQSEYQRIDIFETPEFGRVLTLDGNVMLTERDEFIYDEMITHVPMAIHKEARDILVSSFGEFAPDMAEMMDTAFRDSWIDFYPHEGKVGGAFCAGVGCLKQSRILTNFNGTFDAISTLAHELGHAYHNKHTFSHRVCNRDYSMPVAETASTFNETVITLNAVRKAQSKDEKLALIETMLMGTTQIVCDIYSRFLFEDGVFHAAGNRFLMKDDLKELMTSMTMSATASYDNNLQKLGYVDFANPSQISIYPRDFESKEEVVKILDSYNNRMEKEGKEEQVITYTDIVGTLMSSVTNIVDIISYVLIAFVAISLVVSSIMIGVITYISVLERKKEIGILRAIGASKGNVSQVFNAETFIIGLCAGLIGIGLSLLLLIPGNMIIHEVADNNKVNAFLPVLPGIVLILLSIGLTLLGGIIPSRKAAKSDPVTALRND